MMHDALQPHRTTRSDRENIISEPLGENPPAVIRHLTNEPPRNHLDADLFAGAGQIGNQPKVATVNPAREHPTQRTTGRRHVRADGQNYRVG